jgi:hypothetical protein
LLTGIVLIYDTTTHGLLDLEKRANTTLGVAIPTAIIESGMGLAF